MRRRRRVSLFLCTYGQLETDVVFYSQRCRVHGGVQRRVGQGGDAGTGRGVEAQVITQALGQPAQKIGVQVNYVGARVVTEQGIVRGSISSRVNYFKLFSPRRRQYLPLPLPVPRPRPTRMYPFPPGGGPRASGSVANHSGITWFVSVIVSINARHTGPLPLPPNPGT